MTWTFKSYGLVGKDGLLETFSLTHSLDLHREAFAHIPDDLTLSRHRLPWHSALCNEIFVLILLLSAFLFLLKCMLLHDARN